MNINQFYELTTFLEQIEFLKKSKNLEYMDAILLWCEKNNLEIETAAGLIKKDPVIKEKLRFEAENLNFIKKSARLPI